MIKNLLLLLVLLALIPACSIFAPVEEKVAAAVNRYCQEPYTARETIRETVNRMIDPNKVAVHCAGDPPVVIELK